MDENPNPGTRRKRGRPPKTRVLTEATHVNVEEDVTTHVSEGTPRKRGRPRKQQCVLENNDAINSKLTTLKSVKV